MIFHSVNKDKITDHFDGKHFFFPYKRLHHSFLDVFKWRLLGIRPQWPKLVPVTPAIPAIKHDDGVKLTYIGHATVLIQACGINLLIDPHFSLRASPFQWLGPKRVKLPGVRIEDLPPIDVIFISHNHYDHLDIPSLKKICVNCPLIITPLGNENVLHKNLKDVRIQTLDWQESFVFSQQLSIKLFPAQHWSARSLFDRNRALWSSALFEFNKQTVFFMGDSGFNLRFFEELKKMINQKIDLAILPIGSYCPRWFMSGAHMGPEDAWEVFKLLESDYFLPIHYDVFQLGDEPYGEALTRLTKAAGSSKNQLVGLDAGQTFLYKK